MIFQRALELWILWCAGLAFAGWAFSAFSALGGAAYIGFSLVFVVLVLVGRRQIPLPRSNWRRDLRKAVRRFRRLPPFLYLCIVIFSALGALVYPTIHFDSLSYRLPRVLHWLAEGKWHWIHTPDSRMNVVATATEWIWTPIMLLTDSERVLACTNLISFCFLPGLLYAFFTRVGISRRLAWWWMWILPGGFCYALQAGSLATDAYATIFALGAVVYAFKASEARRPYFLWVSILAIGFATGTKQTNLIVVPLWFVVALLSRKLVIARPFATAAVVLVALGASFLPNCVANLKYAGSWNGFRLDLPSPFWAIVGNSFALPLENLLPPFFPPAREWNAAMLNFVETPFGSHFKKFEHFAALYRGPSENTCGLGLTTCLLLLGGLVSCRGAKCQSNEPFQTRLIRMTLLVAPWLLVLVYMTSVLIARSARYLAFFYPFLFAGILYLMDRPYRFRWWRAGVYLSLVITLVTIALLRQRPLLPVPLVADAAERFVSKNLADRTRNAFSFVPQVRKTIDAFHNALPPGTKVAGYICEVGHLELALWHPYGARRVWRYGAKDCLDPNFSKELSDKGIEYAILDDISLERTKPSTIDEWLEVNKAEVVFSLGMPTEPELPPRQVWLVRFNR